jgi:hypothetical protein
MNVSRSLLMDGVGIMNRGIMPSRGEMLGYWLGSVYLVLLVKLTMNRIKCRNRALAQMVPMELLHQNQVQLTMIQVRQNTQSTACHPAPSPIHFPHKKST